MAKDHLVDKRIVERNIHKGLLTDADYKKHVAELPDLESKGVFVDYGVDEDEDLDDEG